MLNKCPILVAVLTSLAHASAARAEEVFKVPADYPTIQAAVDAARVIADDAHIKVAGGHYRQRLHVRDLPAGGQLVISGGWDAAYANRDASLRPCTLDGDGIGPVVKVTGDNFRRFQMFSFTIVGGNARARGASTPPGGLYVSVGGSEEVRFDDLRIEDHRLRGGPGAGSAVQLFVRDSATVTFRKNVMQDNRITGDGASGAGLRAVVRGDAFLNLERNDFLGNRVRATDEDGTAQAAGAQIELHDEAHLSIGVNTFVGNRARSAGAARYAALVVTSREDARASLGRNSFLDNRTESDRGDATGTVKLSGVSSPGDRATVTSHEETYRDNVVGDDGHVLLLEGRRADVSFTDSLIATSDGSALRTSARSTGQVVLTNLTIADNAGRALRVTTGAGGTTYLSNSLLHGNATDTPSGGPLQTANLIGTDPLFVARATGDYHLQPGSPAIDTGNNAPPPAGGLAWSTSTTPPAPSAPPWTSAPTSANPDGAGSLAAFPLPPAAECQ